jgi:hypothetical protein
VPSAFGAATPAPTSSFVFGAAAVTPAPALFGAASPSGASGAGGATPAATLPPAPGRGIALTAEQHAAALAATAGGGACVRIVLGLPLPAVLGGRLSPAGATALARLRALRHAAHALRAGQPLPTLLTVRAAPVGNAAAATLAAAEALYAAPGAPCFTPNGWPAEATAPQPELPPLAPPVCTAEYDASIAVWTLAHDVALAEEADTHEIASGMFQQTPAAALDAPLDAPLRNPLLEPFPVAALKTRLAALEAFVALLLGSLQLLPLGAQPEAGEEGSESSSDASAPAALLAPLLRLVRRSHHAPLLCKERERGGSGRHNMPTLRLDRRCGVARPSLVAQVAGRIMKEGGSFFHPSSGRDRWWSVEFAEENGMDGGGLYRESVSCLADELQGTSAVPLTPPLLLPAPNAAAGMGMRMADAVLAPGDAVDKELLRFVGRLMAGCALALPGGEHLSVSLTPFSWAHIAAVVPPASLQQFRSVDAHFVNTVQSIAAVDADTFLACYSEHPFSIMRSDDVEVPLAPGGEARELTLATRHEFVALATATRLAESATATAALRAGLLDVMPPQLLALWPPAALELAVCGDAEISEADLKRTTQCNLNDVNRSAFWGAVELMTHRQRSDMLRFATGRQRLPVSLNVSSMGVDGTHLAKAASCYNTLYLPDYQTPQQALEKLLKTFELCLEFDNR